MRYRYLDDFRRGISVFAIFSYGIAVLGTPQCPPRIGVSKYSCSSFQPLENMRDKQQTLKKKIDFLAARLSGIINERLV